MAISIHERVGKAMEQIRAGLAPFFVRGRKVSRLPGAYSLANPIVTVGDALTF